MKNEKQSWKDLLNAKSVPQTEATSKPKNEKVVEEKKENPKDFEIADLKRRLKNLSEAKDRMNGHYLDAEETIKNLQREISQLKSCRESGPCADCDRLREEIEGQREINDSLRLQLSELEENSHLNPERRIFLKEVFKSYWSKWKNKGTSDRKDRFHFIRRVMGFTIEELEEVAEDG